MTFLFSFKNDICKTSLGNPGLDSRLSTALSYGNHTFIKKYQSYVFTNFVLKIRKFLKTRDYF